MIIAMILAHLVGDYILQWDSLARWKSCELKGVLVHGLVILAVTWLFALPFDPGWWQGILFISITHVLIDAAQLYYHPPIPPLLRFTIDQALHFTMIFIALAAGGFLSLSSLGPDLIAGATTTPWLTAVTFYAFVTMPAWVLLKFLVYAFVKHSPPEFPGKPNKYVGISERLIIMTMVVFGQVLLVPLVALPRVLLTWPRTQSHQMSHQIDPVYMADLATSILLAVLTGYALRLLPL
ncbi:MAG: DUF3307 domain-containing protein [Chloroflexota bacterium]